MQEPDEKELVKHFTSRARKVKKSGNSFLVPHKYSSSGEIVSRETFNPRTDLSKLNLNDWRFLSAWRKHGWNSDKAKDELNLPDHNVELLVKKLDYFRTEEARDLALAAIPSTAWVQARHVENVYGGGKLEDSERDSLKELAKIQGAYKNTNQINISTTILNLPTLTPEQEAKVRELADSLAVDAEVIPDAA